MINLSYLWSEIVGVSERFSQPFRAHEYVFIHVGKLSVHFNLDAFYRLPAGLWMSHWSTVSCATCLPSYSFVMRGSLGRSIRVTLGPTCAVQETKSIWVWFVCLYICLCVTWVFWDSEHGQLKYPILRKDRTIELIALSPRRLKSTARAVWSHLPIGVCEIHKKQVTGVAWQSAIPSVVCHSILKGYNCTCETLFYLQFIIINTNQ